MDAAEFVEEWINAWNSHDVERILGHYAADAVFTSPFARLLIPESNGEVHGIAGLRRYWSEGLRRVPEQHSTLSQILETAEGVTVLYRNDRGQVVAETMLFNSEGKVSRGIAAYGT